MQRPMRPMPPTPDDGIEKPKNIWGVPSYVFKVVNGFFSRLFYIIGLVREASPAILVAMTVLCIVTGLLPVFGAYISKYLLDAIAETMGYPSGSVLQSEGFRHIIMLLVFWFVYMFANRISSRIGIMINAIAGELVVNHIKLKIMKKASEVDSASFDKPEFYEKMENADREAGMRPIQILHATFDVISTFISMASFIVILGGLHPLAPVAIIVMALPVSYVQYLFRRKNYWYMRHRSKERREMEYFSSQLVDKDKVKEMRLMNLSDTFIDKYKGAFSKYYGGIKKLIVREGVATSATSLVSLAVNCALFAYVAYRVIYGSNMQIGDYSLYTGALNSITSCVASVIASTATIYEGTLFINNMMVFMKEKPTIVPNTSEPLIPEHGVAHTIEFENVSFAYPGTEKPVLRNINLSLKSGESTVLVGLNGAGKTTLIKLLTRLYDPTEGRILLDGKDLRSYDVKKLYGLYGIIFQDFGKYAVTAGENIAFGDVTVGYDEERVKAAAVSGNSAQFIEKLPDGYNTPLMRYFEENGTELSVGQWQKLSVSRAFYKDSDILILDEPTASLDAMAEAAVYEEFAALGKNKITVFVSHRLSSATTADRIIVLENGEIAESGNHRELMNLCGKYFRLFSTQAKHYVESNDCENSGSVGGSGSDTDN